MSAKDKNVDKTTEKFAISPTRQEDYPEWYQQVIKLGELAENAPVRGCMIVKPWGYGIWENIQRRIDTKIKAMGHENAYFPLFIPLSFLEKEATHIEGFAKECAVVTHARLETKDGKLVPTGELEEPLIVRPTSETIIGHAFAKWIKSYRDLPLLLNQWANVVRWEMRPRLFLRTTEFLWQEGHTAHSSETEAKAEAFSILEMYRDFVEKELAIPLIIGEKTPREKFPGAEITYTFEAMMQDRKAIQSGTSHYLGQNFSKAFDIRFLNRQGEQEYAYTTSWAITTRLIGALIMTHGDDDGLRLPPRIAPRHIVIIPFLTKPELEHDVLSYCESLSKELQKFDYHGQPLQVIIDKKDIRGGEKNWNWIKKGIPLRIEVGPRDIATDKISFARRDEVSKEKHIMDKTEFLDKICSILDDIQIKYFHQAQEVLKTNICKNIHDFEAFKQFFTPKNQEKPEIHGGFVWAKWCENSECEDKLADLKVSIRCLPLEQSKTQGKCVICGNTATVDAIYAKSY
jgi:prolyl-tRNA synthetase